jgi:transposase
MECPDCGFTMNYDEIDDCEPLKVYRCSNKECKHVEFIRINGYEG